MSYNCEILADSLSPQGHRLTTMKITFPRYILAELNTHRMFSRNSASSRAIPFKKMVKMVEENPFIPIAWQKDHKGMQGTEYVTKSHEISFNEMIWQDARDEAVSKAKNLNEQGVTKQLCNRLLEPFMWHTVIVTASEFSNFFKLRCPQYSIFSENMPLQFKSKKDLLKYVKEVETDEFKDQYDNLTELSWLEINKSQAEIHIQAIAELMWDAYNESKPKELKAGDWHIPFGDNMNLDKLIELNPDIRAVATLEELQDLKIQNKWLWLDKVRIAVARCARISYETLGDNPKIDYEADIKLHDMLAKMEHMSPFEHVARVMNQEEYNSYIIGKVDYQEGESKTGVGGFPFVSLHYDEPDEPDEGMKGWCRNFRGFIQYRSLID